MALLYSDASALVKLILDEPESEALRTFVASSDIASCELVLTELPRAIRRAVWQDERLPLKALMRRAEEVIGSLALVPLDRGLLLAAGALDEPGLRTLDAIHVASAASLAAPDAFVSYDERQSAAARLAGLRTIAPGT